MIRPLYRQRGGATGAIIKLILMIMLAYFVVRTDAHLDKKYKGPPPAGVTQPVQQPPNKVR